MHSSLNQGYTDEAWGFSDIIVSALDGNKDCPSAYVVCASDPEEVEDNVCEDAGAGWEHVRHVHSEGNVVFHGIPDSSYTVSYDTGLSSFEDGVWTLNNNHITWHWT